MPCGRPPQTCLKVATQARTAWGIQMVKDGRRPPVLWVGHLRNGRKAASGLIQINKIQVAIL
jgi:hypothetical protein